MEFTTIEKSYLKDAAIDRIHRITDKIKLIEGAGKLSPKLENHVVRLKEEASSLEIIKQRFEQEIYNSGSW